LATRLHLFAVNGRACQNRMFVQSSRQEYSYEQTDFAAAPEHDRRYDDPQHVAEYPEDLYVVASFSAFHGRSPDVRDYHLHLVSRNLKPTTINPIIGALRFFYGTTLGQKHLADQIPYARRADSLPAVLSREEVERRIDSPFSIGMTVLSPKVE
jgi:integrase